MDPNLLHQIITPVLAWLALKPERPVRMPAFHVTLFHLICTTVKSHGVDLSLHSGGPWKVDTTGALGSLAVPAIHRGDFSMADHELSWEIAAILNWCVLEEPLAVEPPK
ncbi:MAG: hypothetical protein ABJD11_18990 [Gemmatimonadota bacterium]